MICLAIAFGTFVGYGTEFRDGASDIIGEMTERLLEGNAIPVDLDSRIMKLSPVERIRVIIFLRRSGLYNGPGWSIDELLSSDRIYEE